MQHYTSRSDDLFAKIDLAKKRPFDLAFASGGVCGRHTDVRAVRRLT
ncbi:MAG: hypothetical protein OEM00_13000 [Burkholderiaceae bacterium]|nr:hypothetical protein [Burkholderiaceae bacterium]MDH3461859.1 hypothetical protein [Burkholderiaceae bacterium]